MCWYITLVVGGSDRKTLEAFMREQGRDAFPVENASVQSLLLPGEAQHFTTPGEDCDCRTALVVDDDIEPEDIGKHVEKLKRKGWSQAKIDRYLSDRTATTARQSDIRSDSIELWAAILNGILDLPSVQRVGLLIHNYSGGVGDAVFNPTRIQITRQQIASQLTNLERDSLIMAGRK